MSRDDLEEYGLAGESRGDSPTDLAKDGLALLRNLLPAVANQIDLAPPAALTGNFYTVTSGVESIGGSKIALTDASAFYAAHAFDGAVVLVAGERRFVRSNTPTTITLNAPLVAEVPAGTTFVIQRPGTVVLW